MNVYIACMPLITKLSYKLSIHKTKSRKNKMKHKQRNIAIFVCFVCNMLQYKFNFI